MRHPNGLRAAAAAGLPSGPQIGDAYEGGYFAGYISHTANGVATHALIVAPRATGATGTGYTLTTMKAWQTTDSVTGATSLYDGAANTALMINSPAASFCTGLSIGGYSDWYLPARAELDIAYFNLKPTLSNNSTSWGINNYSVPQRVSNYTSGNPTQTSVTAFKSGGSEAFVADWHWASNEGTTYPLQTAWMFNFTNGGQTDDFNFKYNLFRVRAFRKVAL